MASFAASYTQANGDHAELVEAIAEGRVGASTD